MAESEKKDKTVSMRRVLRLGNFLAEITKDLQDSQVYTEEGGKLKNFKYVVKLSNKLDITKPESQLLSIEVTAEKV